MTGTLPAIDGSNLTGTKFSPDADQNLFAGTDAGSNLDGTSNGFGIFLGSCAGKSGPQVVIIIFLWVWVQDVALLLVVVIFLLEDTQVRIYLAAAIISNVFIGQEIGEGCGDPGFTSGNNIRDNIFIGGYAGKKIYEGYGNIALGKALHFNYWNLQHNAWMRQVVD